MMGRHGTGDRHAMATARMSRARGADSFFVLAVDFARPQHRKMKGFLHA